MNKLNYNNSNANTEHNNNFKRYKRKKLASAIRRNKYLDNPSGIYLAFEARILASIEVEINKYEFKLFNTNNYK